MIFSQVLEKVIEHLQLKKHKNFLLKHFATFSDDMVQMVKGDFDNNYVDYFPRKGKVGGAFCSNLPYIKQSRVMMNFDGSLSSVLTLAHELGHAYHGLHVEKSFTFKLGLSNAGC